MDSTIRPTELLVSLQTLVANYRAIKALVAPRKVMAIVKANAYGHGLAAVGRALEDGGVDSFGVAFVEEALELRRAGVSAPILALGGVCGRQLELFLQHDVEITASSVDKLSAIEECAKALGRRARVHLKIDTGMERIGTHYYSCEKLLAASLRMNHTEVCGVFSHFANSEGEDLSSARVQVERFEEAISFYERRSEPCPSRHMANSGAIVQLPESWFDLVRPGLLLYGENPAPFRPLPCAVAPAVRLETEVVFFKVVKKGAKVSYGSTWEADADTRVITIPVGYGDGYPRRLSNRGVVLIGGTRYPIVGRVCMDQCMVNIGPQGTAYNGDKAVLLGDQHSERITLQELADLIETDPRDILVSINTRVPRVYI